VEKKYIIIVKSSSYCVNLITQPISIQNVFPAFDDARQPFHGECPAVPASLLVSGSRPVAVPGPGGRQDAKRLSMVIITDNRRQIAGP
jgi:hypothetical protein